LIAIPLLITIGGGLAVEWLKPKEKSGAPGEANGSVSSSAQAPQPEPVLTGNSTGTTRPSFLGKWYRLDNEDVRLEFVSNGNYLFKWANGELRTYSYSIDENNRITRSEGDVTVEMFFASEDELIYHIHEHNRILPDTDAVWRFKKGEPSHLWRNIGIAVGIILVLILIGANQK
jgi:hypothetical protein